MFTTQFHFKVKPATSIKISYIAVHALAIFVLFLSSTPVFFLLLLWLLIVASLVHALKCEQSFYQVIHRKNCWWISTSTHKEIPCRLLTPIFISRALIILRMRPLIETEPKKNRFKRPATITVLITPQSIDAQLFRRLLVFLRFYHRIEGGEHRIMSNRQHIGIIQRIVQSSAFFALQRTTDN